MVVRKNVAIVFNSHSGKRKARRTVKKMTNFFKDSANLVVTVNLHKEKPESILDYSVDAVCVVGGDGTLQRVLQVLQKNNCSTPILLVPRGSANVVAKSLKVPKKLKKIYKRFLSGSVSSVDVARLNNEHFFISAFALGYFSERITKTASKQKQRFGMWGYILSFFGDLSLPTHAFSIEVDGKTFQKNGHSCFLVNTADLFGFRARRRMSYQDGIFELVVTSNTKFASLVHVVLDFYLRKSKPKFFTLYKGRQFTISTTQTLDAQIDGDRIPYKKRFTIDVLPKSQSFYI